MGHDGTSLKTVGHCHFSVLRDRLGRNMPRPSDAATKPGPHFHVFPNLPLVDMEIPQSHLQITAAGGASGAMKSGVPLTSTWRACKYVKFHQTSKFGSLEEMFEFLMCWSKSLFCCVECCHV